MTIKGISDTVNRTCSRTTLSRLRSSSFNFKTLIVDLYGWLHAGKNVTGVVELLADGLPCPPLIDFVIRRIEMLSLGGKFEIEIVADGVSTLKAGTDQKRQKKREEQRKEARIARKNGEIDKATELFRSSVDITPDVAKQVIDHLNALSMEERKRIGLKKCIVSITEADPMLVYRNRKVPNSCIVSRDFDMVPWGAVACLFKVDYRTGVVELFRREVFDAKAIVSKQPLVVTQKQLIDICVLAGCDYVSSLPNVGFTTAVNNIRQYGMCVRECVCVSASVCMYVCMYVGKLCVCVCVCVCSYITRFHVSQVLR